MWDVINQTEDEEYIYFEYANGNTVKIPKPTNDSPIDQEPTLEDKINYLYYKERGLIL